MAGNKAFANAPNGDGTGDTVLVKSDLLPAEIVNYRTMGATPALVAASLARGGGCRPRADPRRLGAATTSRPRPLEDARFHRTSSVWIPWPSRPRWSGIVGLVVGLPVGIALGRWLWVLFAHQIYAVPEPTVPVVALVLVGVAVLTLVNLVAVLPGPRCGAHPGGAGAQSGVVRTARFCQCGLEPYQQWVLVARN